MLPSAELEEGIKESRDQLGLQPDHKFDLGVLLVHGLGEQMRGDTLTEEGDHIVRWLRRRVIDPNAEDDARVDVVHVVARQRSDDDIETAHAVVRITPPTGKAAEWILAESWWADVFRPATFGELAGWGITVGPWVFATQVAGIRRRMEIGKDVPWPLRIALVPITLLAGLVMLLGAALVGFLITALAVALVVLAMTRIPLLADVARSLQRGLAGGFGDAYVLTRSPIRFGAMATQVRSDLQTLRKACSTVAVVAHSQGTAVSWWALKHELSDRPGAAEDESSKAAPVGLFVTYGQGLRKLAFALTMARGSQTWFHTLTAFASALFLALAGLAFVVGPHWLRVIAFVAMAIIAEAILVSLARRVWKTSGKEIECDWAGVIAREPELRWLDLWASADPGPVGPLDVPGERINSYKIRNLSSTLFDHFVYWQNTTEFVAIVASRLFALGGPKRYAAELTDPRLLVAAMRRHARVLLLMSMRVFVASGIVVGLLHAWRAPAFGRSVMAWVERLNLPLVDGFFDKNHDWTYAPAGFFVVLLLGVIAWASVVLTWNLLKGDDETTYFSGVRRPLWAWFWLLGPLVAVVAGAVAALLWRAYDPGLAVAYVLASVITALLFLTVLASGGTTFAGAEDNESLMLATSKITGGTRSSFLVAGVIAALIVAVPVVVRFIWPDAFGWTLAVESLVLSAVLAIEGVRGYRRFQKQFNAENANLPEPDLARVVIVPFLLPRIVGMAVGRWVLIARGHERDKGLLAHELVHVGQWQELGAVRFLLTYLGAYVSGRLRGLGHLAAFEAIPQEREARALTTIRTEKRNR